MISPQRIKAAVLLSCVCASIALGADAVPALNTGGSLDLAQVDQRLQELQPTEAERRFDQIAWAGNICEALRLAREHGRAVFYFTHDGRMATGRC